MHHWIAPLIFKIKMMNKISLLTKVLLIISAILLVIAIFVPLWRIELDAPQYPEGLLLLIYAHKLGGSVDIINGLNHYIGMKTLHSSDFIEFTILPYIIGFYGLLFLVSAIKGTKRWLYISFIGLALFGVVAMTDFWLWEYNYGHNLDPNAAIIVPGMAYQPPLIGFKQLLNFGAYSVPDIGGWLFIVSGILLLTGVIKETGFLKRFKKRSISTLIFLSGFLTLFNSCGETGPQQLVLNSDKCDDCRMTISDGRFGAELVTIKNRVYKFDDLLCLINFVSEMKEIQVRSYFVNDYEGSNLLIDATNAWYIKHDNLKSPMSGNMAAFNTSSQAKKYAKKWNTKAIKWDEVNKK